MFDKGEFVIILFRLYKTCTINITPSLDQYNIRVLKVRVLEVVASEVLPAAILHALDLSVEPCRRGMSSGVH